MLPLNNAYVTSTYDENRLDRNHRGIDLISMSGDRNVKAIFSGTVRTIAYEANGYGHYVVVQQTDGYRAIYAHLESINVTQNQVINKGDIIGVEGSSGNSTGIHLHLELRIAPYAQGDNYDVAKYLGIENKIGPVESLISFNDDQAIEAIDFLAMNGRVFSEDYWLNALDIVNNLSFIFVKWANDVAALNLYE